jgi:hypothetical protein
MAEELKNQKTPIKVDDLPEPIYDWAVSRVLTGMIRDLNKRLGLDGIKGGIIPDLIGDILIRALPPEKLLSKLAEYLELDQVKAAGVAREIEEKMLRPIEVPLRRDLGVDIKMVYVGVAQAPSKAPAPTTQQTQTISTAPSMPPIYRPATPTPPIPPRPPVPPANIPVKINVPKQAGDQPFGTDSWVNKLK